MATYNYSVLDLSVNSVYGFVLASEKNEEKMNVNLAFTSSGSFLNGENTIEVILNKKVFLTYKLSSLKLTLTQNQKDTILNDKSSLFGKVISQLKIHFKYIQNIPDPYLDQRFILMSKMIFQLLGESDDNGQLGSHAVTEFVFINSFDCLLSQLDKKNVKYQIYTQVLADFVKSYKAKLTHEANKLEIPVTPVNPVTVTPVNPVTVTPVKSGKPNKKDRVISCLKTKGLDCTSLKSGYMVNGKKFTNLDSIIRTFKIKL